MRVGASVASETRGRCDRCVTRFSWYYRTALSAVFSIPDSSPDGRRTRLEIQSPHDQLPDRSRDDEIDRVARSGLYVEDAVAVPFADAFDRSDGPPLDVVGRFPGVDSVVGHR